MILASTVPAGFLRIRRPVLEEMARDSALYMETLGDGSEVLVRDVFQMGRIGDRWYGEDVLFCRRLTTHGRKIWVDPTLVFTHTGRKQWRGSMTEAIGDWRTKRKQEETA
jgi:hypothetical protein